MKLNLKQQLFLYIALAFSVFTLITLVFEQTREKGFKTEIIKEKLDAYATMVNNSLIDYPLETYADRVGEVSRLFPDNLRVTLITDQGEVLFDNFIEEAEAMEDHGSRPEILEAAKNKTGTDIRDSQSMQRPYFYYAKKENKLFVRVALPYDVQVQRFFKSDNIFLYGIIMLFITVLFLLSRITNSFGRSIRELRDYAMNPKSAATPQFFKNEIGDIGKEIALNYDLLKKSKHKIEREREKLLQHIHSSKEGICFFSKQKAAKFYNALFIQHIHLIADLPDTDPEIIFSDKSFLELQDFLETPEAHYREFKIKKQGKVFSVRVVRFEDQSFEVILNDSTKQEEIRQLKQQMLSNIAHELRTPISSLSGYLETVLEKDLEAKTQQYFLNQAFKQTQVMTELIQDMSLINKIDEAEQSFQKETLNLHRLLKKLKEEYAHRLEESHSSLQIAIPAATVIQGNKGLIQSVFKNLIDNALRYAGPNTSIFVTVYKEDAEFYYFSFYDTGMGITQEEHLSKIFDRFYRVDEGRTRNTGGSGLGLSIVKNAIAIHGGTITAKNRKEGGLEFLFQLEKK